MAGNFTYTLTTAGGCSTAQTGTINVNPDVTLSLTSGSLSTNQDICIGTAIDNITYSLSNVSATGATVTGLERSCS
ncbi:MAG: hypothetical protein U0X58_04000 [Flavobacteriaceae bacterium]